MSSDVRAELIKLIDSQVSGFDPDQGLKEQLDSLALMSLMTAIESHFGLRFYTVEIAGDRWATVDEVVSLIVEKQKLGKSNSD